MTSQVLFEQHTKTLLPLFACAVCSRKSGLGMQEKQQPAVRAHANGAADPEEQFRATLDQALTQLQGEVGLLHCDVAVILPKPTNCMLVSLVSHTNCWCIEKVQNYRISFCINEKLLVKLNKSLSVQVEAMGEAMVVIGASNGWGPFPLTTEQADLVLQELIGEMKRIKADVTVLRRRSESGTEKGKLSVDCFPHPSCYSNIGLDPADKSIRLDNCISPGISVHRESCC